ncbi:MAG: Hsp20/alpha crystallin family protein [Deltaproteobacteria bacterium]|nr:Hsp20/alpha crystallin family protein [Deltaproteobacteria bacterium]
MAIKKWHPLSELETMRDEMERMWDELFPTPRRSLLGSPWRRLSSEDAVSIPPIDIVDKEDEVLVKLEVPGVEKQHIDVSVHDNTLHIKGEIKEDKEIKEDQYIRRERSYKSFARSISIPADIDEENVKAELKDGILEVHLPRTETQKPKKITVDVS